MVTITINGQTVQAEEEATVLQVARQIGVDIPALCYHPALTPYAACRLCIVEATLRGRTRIVTSCTYPVHEGLVVETDTDRIHRLRRGLLELYLAQAPAAEVIRDLAAQYGVTETTFAVRDPEEKCILCGLCERVCREVMGKSLISFAYRGIQRKVTTPFEESLDDCLGCGACAFVCPTGAITQQYLANVVKLDKWDAEVPMATCSVCGEPFAPAAAIDYVADKLDIELEQLQLCPQCRRRAHSEALRQQRPRKTKRL